MKRKEKDPSHLSARLKCLLFIKNGREKKEKVGRGGRNFPASRRGGKAKREITSA